MARRTISVTLANADSHFSEIERETGFKGAQVTIRFLFYDLAAERGGVGGAGGVSGSGESAGSDHGIDVSE